MRGASEGYSKLRTYSEGNGVSSIYPTQYMRNVKMGDFRRWNLSPTFQSCYNRDMSSDSGRYWREPNFRKQDASRDPEITARDEVRAAVSCSSAQLVIEFIWPSGEQIIEPLIIPIGDVAGLGLGARSDNGRIKIPNPLPRRAVEDLCHFVDAVFDGRQQLPYPLPKRTKKILRKFLDDILDDLVWIPDPLPKQAIKALNDFLDDILV